MKKHIKPIKNKKQIPHPPAQKAVVESVSQPQKEISEKERIDILLEELGVQAKRYTNFIEQKKHKNAYLVNIEMVHITEKIAGFESNHTALSYAKCGSLAFFIKEFAAAARHYDKAIGILEIIRPNATINLPDIYHGAAQAFEHLKNYDKSIAYNIKAAQFLKRKKWYDSNFLTALYIKISELYLYQKNLTQSILFVHKAIYIQKKETNLNILLIASYYQQIASYHQVMLHTDTSIANFKKSLALLETAPNLHYPEKGIICFSLGLCYSLKDKYFVTLNYFKTGLTYFKNSPVGHSSEILEYLNDFKASYHFAEKSTSTEAVKPYKKWLKTNFPTYKL